MFGVVVGIIAIAGPVFWLMSGSCNGACFAALLSLAMIAVQFSIFNLKRRNSRDTVFILSVLRVLLVALALPAFFAATSKVILGCNTARLPGDTMPVPQRRQFWDSHLLSADTTLLGWIYPYGQFSLFLDSCASTGKFWCAWLAPDAFVGQAIVEILNLVYISFYVWSYACTFLLALRCCMCWHVWRRCTKSCLRVQYSSEDLEVGLNIKKLKTQMCGCAWPMVGAGVSEEEAAALAQETLEKLEAFVFVWAASFISTFAINLILPAKSPRVFIKHAYRTELNGFGLTKFTRSLLEINESAGAFPSGHVGESLAVGFAALRILPTHHLSAGAAVKLRLQKSNQGTPGEDIEGKAGWGIWGAHEAIREWRLAVLSMVFGVGITVATQWMRYHYFVDLLAGTAISLFAWGIGSLAYPLAGRKGRHQREQEWELKLQEGPSTVVVEVTKSPTAIAMPICISTSTPPPLHSR